MILKCTLVVFFWIYKVLSASNFSNVKNSLLAANFNSPEKREGLIKYLFDKKLRLGTLLEKSIFEDTNEIIAIISGISASEQHLQSFKSLCDFITKICNKARKDFLTGLLTQMDRDFITHKIGITIQEFNFAKVLKKFDFFENVKLVQIMLELLAKFDPLAVKNITRMSVLNLSQFCVLNDCLEVFFSVIFKWLENPFIPMPIFMLHSKIKDTSKIDQHFRACVDLLNNYGSKQILPVHLALTIVESPFSIESTEIFMKLINTEELLIQFAQLNLSENKLVFRLIKSKEIDNFMILLTANLCARNVAVKLLKNAVQLRKLEYEMIDKIIKPDQDIFNLSFTNIVNYITKMNFDEKIMISYYEIDSDFIEEVIKKLDQNVQRTIIILKTLTDPTQMYVYLTLAYFFVRLIPIYNSDFLPNTSYEMLFDFKFQIEEKGVKFDLPYATLIKALSLPYVEVTRSGLEKIWSIIKSDFEENESLIICSATKILLARSSNDQLDAAKLLKIFFSFFQSHQLDFSLVARNLIQDFSGDNFFNIFNFCKQHGMFSKAETFIIESCLKNLNTGQDFSSLKIG